MRGRDATPRPWRSEPLAGAEPPAFSGRPRVGGTLDPIGYRQTTGNHQANYGGKLDGFAHDTALEDRTPRVQLRRIGVPVGNEGGLGNLRKIARQYGLATGGLAMDAAPQPSGDVDAPLEALRGSRA